MNIFDICQKFEATPHSGLDSPTQFYHEHFRAVFVEQQVKFSRDTPDDIIFYISTGPTGPVLTVARRESACLLLSELNLDWRATFYANLVLHTLEFTMICAVGYTNDKNVFKLVSPDTIVHTCIAGCYTVNLTPHSHDSYSNIYSYHLNLVCIVPFVCLKYLTNESRIVPVVQTGKDLFLHEIRPNLPKIAKFYFSDSKIPQNFRIYFFDSP